MVKSIDEYLRVDYRRVRLDIIEIDIEGAFVPVRKEREKEWPTFSSHLRSISETIVAVGA